MNKKIAIVQSNYIPWKGYFDLIKSVDLFVLYDDVQYTKADWRNRNKIKTQQGLQWLSIPVQTKGKYFQSIRETRIDDRRWAAQHIKTIRQNYQKAPYFKIYGEWVEGLYQTAARYDFLSEVNFYFISELCSLLKINTLLRWSSEFDSVEGRSERLLSICKQAGAHLYLSGPAAKTYLDQALFQKENVEIVYADYSSYPEYPQLYPPFDHSVTILDLLFNVGTEAHRYLKPSLIPNHLSSSNLKGSSVTL